MATTLAFDVYGTLINTHGVVSLLENMVGDNAHAFSTTQREKQQEYSFRWSLMQNYMPFSVCTEHALDYACLLHNARKDLARSSNVDIVVRAYQTVWKSQSNTQ